jgi:exo-beta-1,3-glucanase (GH17 family)
MKSSVRSLILLLTTGLLAMTLLGCSGSDSSNSNSASADLTNRLYVIAAESGTVTPTEKGSEFVITFDQVWTDVLWFTDRPELLTGENTTTDYVGYLWPLVYGNVAPNAVIKFHVAGANAGLFVALENPDYDSGTGILKFKATLLNSTFDEPPQSLLEFDAPVVTVLNNVPGQNGASSFAIYGESASIDVTSTEGQYTLIQEELDDSVLLANNAPGRYSNVSTTEAFVAQWSGRFGDSPPNAVISGITDTGELYGYLLTLTDPRYDETENRITYSATVLGQETEIPGTLTSATLVLDSAGGPMPVTTPLGVAYGPCGSGDTAELDVIAKHFKVFRLYKFDNTSLDYAKAHGMEVLLGTTNERAQTFATDPSKISSFVTDIMPYLNSGTIKVILLGNEPLNNDPFHNCPDMQSAIEGVYNELKSKGHDIPVSVNVMDNTYWGGGFDTRLNDCVLPAIAKQTNPVFYVDLYPYLSPNNTDPYRLNANLLLTDMYSGGNGNTGWVPAMAAKHPNIGVFIAETGWASAGGNPPNGGVSNTTNEGKYVDSVATWAKTKGHHTILFMMFDRSCKEDNWERHYGLMKDVNTPKQNVTVPTGLVP